MIKIQTESDRTFSVRPPAGFVASLLLKMKTHSRTCDNIMFFHPISYLKCFNENEIPLGPKTAKKASHETVVKNFFMIFSALKFLKVV